MSNPTDAETGEMRPHIPSPILDAIRQRAVAATPGPWRVVEEHGRDISDEGWSRIAIQSEAGNRAEVAEIIGDDVSYGAEEWDANAEFLAHAREDIPALVAALNAALRLHGADSYGNCCECGGEDDPQGGPWPCLTVRDIRAALNGEAIR